MSKSYVLDTSAFIALTLDEAGSNVITGLFSLARKRKAQLYISFITLTEVYYIVYRNQGEEAAHRVVSFIKTLPLETVYPNDILVLSAGRIKANHPLSIADAFVAATAIEKKAVLVHKDPELESMVRYVEVLNLPYKN